LKHENSIIWSEDECIRSWWGVAGRGGAEGGGGGVDREIQDSSYLSFIPSQNIFTYYRKITKKTISFFMSAYSSFLKKQLGSPWKVFR